MDPTVRRRTGSVSPANAPGATGAGISLAPAFQVGAKSERFVASERGFEADGWDIDRGLERAASKRKPCNEGRGGLGNPGFVSPINAPALHLHHCPERGRPHR